MEFAERMSVMRASKIRELFDRARSMPGAVDLSIGQAHFDVPDEVKAATVDAVGDRCGGYSATEGFPELVEATRVYLRERHGLGADEEVMMTVGATGAITLAMMTLVGPGDEVLMADPYFVVYRNVAQLAGATPVFCDIYPDFQLSADRLMEHITPRTRMVVLNSPANPTGAAMDPSSLAAVARLCGERGIPVLSDEIYERFVYDAPHTSIKRAGGCESVLVGGFSKTWGMAGWRLGWAAGPPELIDKMRTLQQFLFTCPPTLVQRGALAAFGLDVGPQVQSYRRRRDLVVEALADAGYDLIAPAGSFFAFPRVPWGDDLAFMDHALERGLVVVPGRAFSRAGTHFRISFAASEDTLERGLEILAEIVEPPRAADTSTPGG